MLVQNVCLVMSIRQPQTAWRDAEHVLSLKSAHHVSQATVLRRTQPDLTNASALIAKKAVTPLLASAQNVLMALSETLMEHVLKTAQIRQIMKRIEMLESVGKNVSQISISIQQVLRIV